MLSGKGIYFLFFNSLIMSNYCNHQRKLALAESIHGVNYF